MSADTPHSASFEAEVSPRAGNEIHLFAPNGSEVTCNEVDLAYFLGLGFTREVFSPTDRAQELRSLFAATADAVVDSLTTIAADGEIDRSEDAALRTAEFAMNTLNALWRDTLDRVHRTLPYAEPAGVTMRHDEGCSLPDGRTVAPGTTTTVDPSQLALHANQGWQEVG